MWRLKEFAVLQPKPHPALADVAESVRREFGNDIITSAFRPGDPGVHGTTPLRGLDLRERDVKRGRAIAAWVNALWCYDPTRPAKQVAIYHDVGQGVHLHLQVHPNTVSRET